MSLNSSSGSMTHSAKQQSMNDQRRKTNALKRKTEIVGPEVVEKSETQEVVEPVIKSEEKIVDLGQILDPLTLSENLKKGAHDKIIYFLDNKNNPNEKYIHEIISKLDENFIQRVKRGTYFEIGGVLYQVTEMPILDGGEVDARTVFPENFENISPRHTFTTKEVLHSMITANEAHHRIVQGLLADGISNTLPPDNYILEYPYMDKDGIPRATMDDVRLANKERYADLERARLADERRRKILQPQYNRKDLITKIPEPYFNKDNLDV